MITNLDRRKYGDAWAKAKTCFYCGRNFGKRKNIKTREHWIDKIIGGAYIVAAHGGCNRKKSELFDAYHGHYIRFIQNLPVNMDLLMDRHKKYKSDYFLELAAAISIKSAGDLINHIRSL